jgi:RNA polymerase primary sigma factor
MANWVDGDIECYLREISRYQLLKPEEEQDLARRIARGDMDARERMIRSNLRLVVNIAKNYVSSGLPLMDLIAEGNLGLMKAAERFRPDEGASFSTYASWWIKQAIRRAITTKVKNVRVPAYMADIVAKWRRVANELAQGLERSATADEVADAMRLNPEKIAIIQQALGADSSSRVGRRAYGGGRGDEEEMGDFIEEIPARPGEDATVEDFFSGQEAEKVDLLLRCLSEREERIVRLRYGFGTGKYMTLQNIGKKLNLTRERVRQIEAQALRKMLKILGEE